MPIRAHFKPTPEGDFHPGIPARDLEDDEYRALNPDQRHLVRTSPLYDYVLAKDLDQAAPDEDDEQEAPATTEPPPAPDPAAPADGGETS